MITYEFMLAMDCTIGRTENEPQSVYVVANCAKGLATIKDYEHTIRL